jgi:hypothetical protein
MAAVETTTIEMMVRALPIILCIPDSNLYIRSKNRDGFNVM